MTGNLYQFSKNLIHFHLILVWLGRVIGWLWTCMKVYLYIFFDSILVLLCLDLLNVCCRKGDVPVSPGD